MLFRSNTNCHVRLGSSLIYNQIMYFVSFSRRKWSMTKYKIKVLLTGCVCDPFVDGFVDLRLHIVVVHYHVQSVSFPVSVHH